MRRFLWLCLFTLIPGLLLRINVGGPGVLPLDILGIGFALFWLWDCLFVTRSFPTHKMFRLGGIFAFVALLSFVWNGWQLPDVKAIVLSLSYWVRFVVALIFGWAAIGIFKEQKDRDTFYKRFLVITGIILTLGFLQFFVFPDLRTVSEEGGWDPHIGRLLGTWMDPNIMAGFIGFMLPIVCGELYRKNTPQKLPIIAVLGLLLGGLLLTYSRSGYVAGLIGLGVFFMIRDFKIVLLAGFIGLLGISVDERSQKRVEELTNTVSSIVMSGTSEVDPTASLRIQSWMNSLELFYKRPVLGIGYNTYRYIAAEEGIVQEHYFSSGGSDSSHLTVLVTTGLIGMVFFLFFYAQLVIDPLKAYIQQKDIRGLGLACGFIALFFHAFFVNSLLFPFIFIPAMIFAGIHEARYNSKDSAPDT